MDSLWRWLRLFCLLNVIVEFKCYILLARDADDFRNIAKQIVPETLADKLARLASDTPVKQVARYASGGTEYYYESEAEDFDEEKDEEDSAVDNNAEESDRSEGMYDSEWNSRVNFDELVERVKDRLAKELSEKLTKHNLSAQGRNPSQVVYNNIKDIKLHNDRIKNSVKKGKSSGYSYDDNTYGYNDYKNKRKPEENHKVINIYDEVNYQASKQNTSSFKNFGNMQNSFENNKHNYNKLEKQAQEIYEEPVTTNYEPPNDYLITDSNENRFLNKGKQADETKHEEDNNLFHLNNKKPLTNSNEEFQNKKSNKDFNKKYIDSDDSLKYKEKDETQYKYEESELTEHNHDDDLSKTFIPAQKKFVAGDVTPTIFDEFDLAKRKNDSYEDYIIPNTENKFASDETNAPIRQDDHQTMKYNSLNNSQKSKYKLLHNNNYQTPKTTRNERPNIKAHKVTIFTKDYRDATDKSQEVKAKTESLWYNYDDVRPKTIKDGRLRHREITLTAPTRKSKAIGTMIPTREYYKMSSPNYYISQPTVVEKYDSKEPLPERDREKEVIKHFGNPEASINKKVRLI